LVPKVDADGNEIGAASRTWAPLGTYLGWNITADSTRPFHRASFAGTPAALSFRKTKARLGQQRPACRSKSSTDHAGYVVAVRKAAANAVAQKFLLQKDADAPMAAADASNVLK
jgi:hypothetical protein